MSPGAHSGLSGQQAGQTGFVSGGGVEVEVVIFSSKRLYPNLVSEGTCGFCPSGGAVQFCESIAGVPDQFQKAWCQAW